MLFLFLFCKRLWLTMLDAAAGCASCCFDSFKNYTAGCADPNNGSDPYGIYHTIEGYRTDDLETWEYMGTVLRLQDRPPGTVFRPAVVYNPKTQLFVMWCVDVHRPFFWCAVAL